MTSVMIGEMTGHGKLMAVQDREDSMSGFPEVIASTLRSKGVQVKEQKGRAKERISLVRVSVHIKNC